MESSPTTTASGGAFCAACGARLSATARFCHRCGAPVGGGVEPRGHHTGPAGALPWGVAALALIALIALLAGQFFGGRQRANAAASQPDIQPAGRAPDISSMSPEERADRLFLRVMRYVADGKRDSAQFFLPMAVGAIEAITPRTLHQRYDLGLLGLVNGDGATAAAQADTMLRQRATHLLGLMLAASAADARADTTARSGFERRLLAAEQRELADSLPEYVLHRDDINSALARARTARSR